MSRYVPRIGSGFPPDEGCRLARAVLESRDTLEGLEVDVRGVSSATLIGPFFFAFLQTVHEIAPEHLGSARKIRWILTYDFQREYVADWMRSFKPN